MADNSTLPATGEIIATDELVTLNGVASTGVKAQRTKVGYGIDGDLIDVSAKFGLPVNTDSKRRVSYYGRASTLRTPGRAGTVGQKIFTFFNASGSSVVVDIEEITIDSVSTVIKAVTVLPPAIRLYRITTLPTGGTALSKISRDTNLTSAAAIATLGDASADGASSASALTATGVGIYDQAFASRLITAAGYEMLDQLCFVGGEDEKVTLRANEGITVSLDYTLATQNPITDMWLVNCKWSEYTEPN